MKNIIKFNQTETILNIRIINDHEKNKTVDLYINNTLFLRVQILGRQVNYQNCNVTVHSGDTLWSEVPIDITTSCSMHQSIPCNPEQCNEKLCNIFRKYELVQGNKEWVLVPPCQNKNNFDFVIIDNRVNKININENLYLLQQIDTITLEDMLQIIKVKNKIQQCADT